jgi:hypothetical protein
LVIVGVVVAMLAVGCSGDETDAAPSSSTSPTSEATTTTAPSTTTVSPTTTLPALSDAATIWCDEERWQVLRRAEQLGLDTPQSNPTPQELGDFYSEKLFAFGVPSDWEPTDSDAEERDRIMSEWEAKTEKYESDAWDARGVVDRDWTTWMRENSDAYIRSCAAAYELAAGGGEALSTPPTTQWTDKDIAASTVTTSSSAGGTTTTTSTLPGRLIPGTVVACPDFIEATFRNTGGRAVTIVEIILFIEGIDEQPFGYGTDWTPTLQSGDTATWRATAYDLGLDWIWPGLVSVGARPHTSSGDFVYAEGPNPNSSCTAVAPTTTTTAPPPSVLDATGSSATCSTGGIDMTFTIRNTGTGSVELYQVALFPGGPMGHSFLDPDWWPLPTVGPGETVSHRETFSGGSLDTFTPGTELEIFIDSSDGRASTFIVCS